MAVEIFAAFVFGTGLFPCLNPSVENSLSDKILIKLKIPIITLWNQYIHKTSLAERLSTAAKIITSRFENTSEIVESFVKSTSFQSSPKLILDFFHPELFIHCPIS